MILFRILRDHSRNYSGKKQPTIYYVEFCCTYKFSTSDTFSRKASKIRSSKIPLQPLKSFSREQSLNGGFGSNNKPSLFFFFYL